jgi:hypothetical protein
MRAIVDQYLKEPSRKLLAQLTTMEQNYVKNQQAAKEPAKKPAKEPAKESGKDGKKLTGIG